MFALVKKIVFDVVDDAVLCAEGVCAHKSCCVCSDDRSWVCSQVYNVRAGRQ